MAAMPSTLLSSM